VQALDAVDNWFQSTMTYRCSFVAKATAVAIGAVVRIGLVLGEAPLVAFAWAILFESTLLAGAMTVAYRASGASPAALAWSPARAKAMLASGWPLALSTCLSAVYLRIDQVMLGQMAGFAEVGAYAIAARVVEVTYVIPAVLAAAVFPAMVKSKDVDGREYAARMQRLFDLAIWVAICLSIALALTAGSLVELLVGHAYAGATPVLAVLAWMPVWAFFGMLRQRWLVVENELRAALSIDLLACVLNVACNLLLIPLYGAMGAALAALFAAVGSTLLLVPFVASVRRSGAMFLRALAAPVLLLRRNAGYL
jgi:O-antigen/teichoic acid export membrane protein